MADDAAVLASPPTAEADASPRVPRLAKGDWVLFFAADDGSLPVRQGDPMPSPKAVPAQVVHVVRPGNPRSSLWLTVHIPGAGPQARLDVRFAPEPRVDHWSWLDAS